MSSNNKAKVDEKKENRELAKKRERAAKVAEAHQKQKMPPYGIDPKTGSVRRPEQTDMAKKAWADKQKAQADKQARTDAYNASSSADKAALNATTAAKQAAARQAAIANNTKGKNRLDRIDTKAVARITSKLINTMDATAAKTTYTSVPNLPKRHESYTSPQGKPYSGRDTRQAVFSSAFAAAKGGVGYNAITGKASKNKEKLPKDFQNRPNSDGTIPLPGEQPLPGNPLKEFPMLHDKKKGYDGRKPNPSEARIITQKNATGETELKARIGHPSGTDDHKRF